MGCVATAAPAQVSYQAQQPTQKLLVLPLTPKSAADSVFSIAVTDVAREKLAGMARYKVQVIPKPKLCEALKASDYPCDVLLDETQANQLGRFLSVNGYTIGTLERSGGTITATIRVRDIGSSGMAALFTLSSSNPGTAASVGETIAQRLNNVVRAAEQARECEEQRKKSQFSKAVDAARKALAIEPNLPAAHICIATVYEAQHMPLDSLLAAYQRAAKGDSLNATAWENIAHVYQQKGDTLKAIDALTHELAGEPHNIQPRLGVAELLRQQKQYERAKAILDDGLAKNPNQQRLLEVRERIRIEGQPWRCVLDRVAVADRIDSAKAYLAPALSSPDSTDRLSASVFMLTAGSKLAQAGAYDRAYPWLDQLLQLVALRTPADTAGPRQQIRLQASFWYGVSSVASLTGPYTAMVKSKSCTAAKAFDDRLVRTKDALIFGARVHRPTAETMLQNVSKFEAVMPQVMKQFKF